MVWAARRMRESHALQIWEPEGELRAWVGGVGSASQPKARQIERVEFNSHGFSEFEQIEKLSHNLLNQSSWEAASFSPLFSNKVLEKATDQSPLLNADVEAFELDSLNWLNVGVSRELQKPGSDHLLFNGSPLFKLNELTIRIGVWIRRYKAWHFRRHWRDSSIIDDTRQVRYPFNVVDFVREDKLKWWERGSFDIESIERRVHAHVGDLPQQLKRSGRREGYD